MSAAFTLRITTPGELTAAERAAWRAFRDASPRLASPYFDLRYVLAAGSHAPGAQVAVAARRGRTVGFFAFQRRGGLLQPLGAPMTDYHGLVCEPGDPLALEAVLAMLPGRKFRFGGLTDAVAAEGLRPRRRMTADLAQGFEAWAADRQARFPKFYKDKARTLRSLRRDLGPVRLAWGAGDGAALADLLAWKRAQYRRTGQHDVFACGWTERLVRGLAAASEPDFGLRIASLHAGDRRLAVEIGLVSGGVYHLWLPGYDPAFARYGPGMLTTLETLRRLPQAGVTAVDFGRDDADYKAYFADPSDTVLEGLLRRGRPTLSTAAAPTFVRSLRERVGRRLDVISACETTAWGWCVGAAMAAGVAAAALAPVLVSAGPARALGAHRASATAGLRTDRQT